MQVDWQLTISEFRELAERRGVIEEVEYVLDHAEALQDVLASLERWHEIEPSKVPEWAALAFRGVEVFVISKDGEVGAMFLLRPSLSTKDRDAAMKWFTELCGHKWADQRH